MAPKRPLPARSQLRCQPQGEERKLFLSTRAEQLFFFAKNRFVLFFFLPQSLREALRQREALCEALPEALREHLPDGLPGRSVLQSFRCGEARQRGLGLGIYAGGHIGPRGGPHGRSGPAGANPRHFRSARMYSV